MLLAINVAGVAACDTRDALSLFLNQRGLGGRVYPGRAFVQTTPKRGQ